MTYLCDVATVKRLADAQPLQRLAEAGGELEGYHWWMSKGPDEAGCKTEHVSPVSDGD